MIDKRQQLAGLMDRRADAKAERSELRYRLRTIDRTKAGALALLGRPVEPELSDWDPVAGEARIQELSRLIDSLDLAIATLEGEIEDEDAAARKVWRAEQAKLHKAALADLLRIELEFMAAMKVEERIRHAAGLGYAGPAPIVKQALGLDLPARVRALVDSGHLTGDESWIPSNLRQEN